MLEYHRNIVPITSAIWILLIHTFIWYAYVVLFGSCWSIHSYDMHTYVPGKILYVLTCPTKNEFWFTLLFILVKVKWICYSSLSINPNSICLDWPTHLYRVRIRLFQHKQQSEGTKEVILIHTLRHNQATFDNRTRRLLHQQTLVIQNIWHDVYSTYHRWCQQPEQQQ